MFLQNGSASATVMSSQVVAGAQEEANEVDARTSDTITMTLAEKCRLILIVTSIDFADRLKGFSTMNRETKDDRGGPGVFQLRSVENRWLCREN